MSEGRVPVYLRSCAAGPLSYSTLACSSVRDPGGPASFPHAIAYYPDTAPKDVKPIGCRWVYKVRYNTDGSVNRYKAWLVAKCYA